MSIKDDSFTSPSSLAALYRNPRNPIREVSIEPPAMTGEAPIVNTPPILPPNYNPPFYDPPTGGGGFGGGRRDVPDDDIGIGQQQPDDPRLMF